MSHETPSPSRVQMLTADLQREKIQKNPVIVFSISEKQYILLDGTNRFYACKNLGWKWIAVQKADLSSRSIRLSNWGYYGNSLPLEALRERVLSLGMKEHAPTGAPGIPRPDYFLFGWHSAEGHRYFYLEPAGGFAENLVERKAEGCRKIMESFLLQFSLHRFAPEAPPPQVSDTVFFLLPTFNKKDIIHLAQSGVKLPSGVTRFLIAGRALGLEVPAEWLTGEIGLSEAQEKLKAHIQERVSLGRMRFYSESVFVFNE